VIFFVYDSHETHRAAATAHKSEAKNNSSSETSHSASPISSDTEGDGVIGTKVFKADDELLDHHLNRVLDFWHGRRPPQGVDIKNTNRCLCVYHSRLHRKEVIALTSFYWPSAPVNT
jgi:exonuclease V